MSEGAVETQPIRLLYIDDDQGLGRLVERTLSRHGFQVRHALSGDEGLEQLAAEPFDVIALDHFMPGKEGLEVLAEIQRLSNPPPVIYVTGADEGRIAVAALKAGAKDAYLIEEPLAAAIGANVPISGPSGNMIIDIGGGTSEIAVIALGGIVVSHSLRVGGNKFDEAIATYIRKKYNLMVGERTAEEVKIQIGTALPLERELTMEVRGRDLIAGLPRTIPITSSEVMEAIEAPLQQLVAAVRSVLEQTPPELSSDIIDKGMVMSGGGALLRNVDKLLTQVTGVPCHVAENSLDCVALGTGLALEHFDFFKKSLVQQI